MKRKIIVPVDLSAAAHNAYLYARGLAHAYDASLEVVHVVVETAGESDELKATKIENLQKELNDFVTLFPKEEEGVDGSAMVKTDVVTRIITDMPVRSIVRLSESPFSPIVVMGTTGSHGAVDRFFGSVSSSVAQKAYCPVLLIPKGVKYKPIDNILYASNFDSSEEEIVERMGDLANLFSAMIHFIHIREEGETEDFTLTEERIYNKLFERGDPRFAFNMAAINAKSVSEGLNKYADENNVDVIALVNVRRGFIDSLFGKSLTKTMAFKTHLPLMVLHLP